MLPMKGKMWKTTGGRVEEGQKSWERMFWMMRMRMRERRVRGTESVRGASR